MKVRGTITSWMLVALCAVAAGAQERGSLADAPTEGGAPPPPLKVALSGKALEKYKQARNVALEFLVAKRCSTFLNAHGVSPDDVSRALLAQQPQDGGASTISFGQAGISTSDLDPHRGDSVQSAFSDVNFLTVAISQPNGEDCYYNRDLFEHKDKYPYSLPVSVIHEALHNLTGESDVAIAQDFGYQGFVALEANIFVNEALKKHCDSKR